MARLGAARRHISPSDPPSKHHVTQPIGQRGAIRSEPSVPELASPVRLSERARCPVHTPSVLLAEEPPLPRYAPPRPAEEVQGRPGGGVRSITLSAASSLKAH